MTSRRSAQQYPPLVQAENKIKRQFHRFLKPHAKELDITGIQGMPGSYCYLDALFHFEKTHPSVDTHFTRESRALFDRQTAAMIHAEIKKCRLLLEKLEQSPDAVKLHLTDLRQNLNKWKSVYHALKGKPVIGHSHHLIRGHEEKQNEFVRVFIEQTEVEIEKYSALLAALKHEK